MKEDKPKTIVILTTNPFPVGLAGTSRILSYCKGFQHHGYTPEVLCIKPTEPYKNAFNTLTKGRFDSINYSYPGGTTIRVASFLGRRFNDLKAILFSLIKLIKILKDNEVAFVIFYGNYIFTEISSILITRLFRKKIFKEESENPNVHFAGHKSFLTAFIKWFYINKLYRCYHGILAMTHPIQDFFLTKGISEKKILVVPQTVDQKRFEIENSHISVSLPDEYIAYVGSLNQLKDGVLTLVESFKKVSADYPEIHLVIAGNGTEGEINVLSMLIDHLQLNGRVHLIGRISSNEIPSLFHRARLLASCRPQSIQGDYGFPTKVAEYLASGIPVVTTATGELAYFLEDRVNAFIADSTDPDAFAAKILEALQDYPFAQNVAQTGIELVKKEFDPVQQTLKMIAFYKKTNDA